MIVAARRQLLQRIQIKGTAASLACCFHGDLIRSPSPSIRCGDGGDGPSSLFHSGVPLEYPAAPASSSSPWQWMPARCFAEFALPRLKIKIKKDRPLDKVADKAKELQPIIIIRDLILRYPRRAIPFRIISLKRRELGLKISDQKVEDLMRRYPNAFEFFVHPDDKQKWCRLAPQLKELLKEEKRIYAREEPLVVEKLRRLLMLSKDRRIPVEKLLAAARFFGFPDDFEATIIPKYPQYFRLRDPQKPHRAIELVAWDESLAITEFEKDAKMAAKERGHGDEFETRGKPLAFKLKYSAGMQLKKKTIEKIDRWQKLPYICPYQQVDWVEEGSPIAERKMAALMHEVLSLTIEKKILIEVIGDFREEFNFPNRVAKAFNRFPGIFYISLKGNVHTVFLREGYNKRLLIEDHPLVTLKWKYYKMLQDGPRMRSMGFKTGRTVDDGPSMRPSIVSPRLENAYVIQESVDKEAHRDHSVMLSDHEAESSDEFDFSDDE